MKKRYLSNSPEKTSKKEVKIFGTYINNNYFCTRFKTESGYKKANEKKESDL